MASSAYFNCVESDQKQSNQVELAMLGRRVLGLCNGASLSAEFVAVFSEANCPNDASLNAFFAVRVADFDRSVWGVHRL